jgi:hypothetical protein
MNETAFAWVIEMHSASYLGVRKLGCYEFFWTTDHRKALRFKDEEQADLLMMAVRELRPDLFPACLAEPAKPVLHGWLNDPEICARTDEKGVYREPSAYRDGGRW